jgi:hypothetical protein
VASAAGRGDAAGQGRATCLVRGGHDGLGSGPERRPRTGLSGYGRVLGGVRLFRGVWCRAGRLGLLWAALGGFGRGLGRLSPNAAQARFGDAQRQALAALRPPRGLVVVGCDLLDQPEPSRD